jgi:UDP-glucose 4-epimerase/UDP-glucuronate decarboxylase
MRHLVTGGAGVIGFELVRQLLAAGDEVVTVDVDKKGGFEDLVALAREHSGRLQPIRGDLALDTTCLSGRFDAIFHFAAIVGVRYVSDHPYETMAVNMRTTLNVLDHALQHRCKACFFASSSENYAASVDHGYAPIPTPENVLLSIDDIELPRWSYAASKIAGESAVFGAARIGGFTPVVVRFHNVYGPRMGPTHVIPEMLARARQRVDPFPIFGSDQTRSFLHVEDAGRALVTVLGAALEKRGGLYNLGSAVETKIGDLARVVFDVTGFHPRVDEQPAPPGSVRRRVPDVAKLTALGFEPRWKLRDGIAQCWTGGRVA